MKSKNSMVLLHIGFTLAILTLLGLFAYTGVSFIALSESNEQVSHTLLVQDSLDETLNLLADAETSQRGYIITGDEAFLEPYSAALDPRTGIRARLAELRELIRDDLHQQERLDRLEELVEGKLESMRKNIDLRTNEGFEAAQASVASGRGREQMDAIRALIQEMVAEESALLQSRSDAASASLRTVQVMFAIGAPSALAMLVAVFVLLAGQIRARRRAQESLQKLNAELDQRVSERTAALAESEQTLKEIHSNLELVLSASPLPILGADAEGRITSWNKAAERLFGWSEQEVLGKLCPTVPPDGVEDFQAMIRGAMRGEAVDGLVRYRQKSGGASLICSIYASAQRNANAEAIGVTIILEDITERKRAEDVLRLSEERFAKAFRASPDGIVISNMASGEIVEVNDSFCLIFGYGREEVLGFTSIALNMFANPDDRARAIGVLKQQGYVHNFELQIRCKSGEVREAALSVESLDINSKPHLLTIIRDITERKQVEEQQRQATTRARILAEFSRALAEVSDDYARVLDLVTQRVVELVADNCTIRLLSEDGEWLVPKAIFDVDPEALAFTRDLLAAVPLRVSEQPITKQIFESGQGLLLPVVDKERLKSSVKPQYWPVLDRVGSNSMVIVPLFAHGRSIGLMYLSRHRAGQPSFEESDLVFAQDLADRTALAISNARLLAEIRELNATLEMRVQERTVSLTEARQEAERANLAKSEFLSRMSHELRTPMNSILGFAQLLKMDELSPDQLGSLEHILKSGRHLLDLINEVLDISRIESAKIPISPEPVHLDEALRSAVDLIQPLADNRSISIAIKIPSSRDVYVTADKQRLKQVLLNLLSNAVKYNREGGQIHITASLLVDGFMHLAVRDTGNGIPPEKMERLFVPFERLELDPAMVEGTGLGLALSKGLVEAMGGRIGAQSTVGVGSIFWLDLQLTTQQKEAIVMAEVDDYLMGSPGAKKGLVLYVEDNLSNIQLIEKILDRMSQDVQLVSAMQGRLAMDLARQHQPGLILLDLHLPDVHGEEVLKWLRAEPETRDIPIVVMSADATHHQIERALAAGANAYLTKPIDVKEFLKVVGETLGS